MKFEIGDKVKILDSHSKEIKQIAKMIGKVYTINAVYSEFDECFYNIEGWTFNEDELELVERAYNQKAIEELENFYKLFEMYENAEKDTIICFNGEQSFLEYIDERIKELKGE